MVQYSEHCGCLIDFQRENCQSFFFSSATPKENNILLGINNSCVSCVHMSVRDTVMQSHTYLSCIPLHPRTICCQTLLISFMEFLAATIWLPHNCPFIVLYSIVNVLVVCCHVLIKSLELLEIITFCPYCPYELLIPSKLGNETISNEQEWATTANMTGWCLTDGIDLTIIPWTTDT